MRSRLNQLAKGIVEYEAQTLTVEPAVIREEILPGKVFSFELKISAERLSSLHLFFYSLDPRVKVARQQTSGKEIRVGLEISTIGLEAGDVLNGKISIVYNGGEVTVPYEIRIAMVLNGRRYDFRKVDDFASYALAEPAEAAEMFGKKDFIHMPFLEDLSLRAVYETFRSSVAEDSGLSAFLTALGKPVPVFRIPNDRAMGRPFSKKQQPAEGSSKDPLKLIRVFLAWERCRRGDAAPPAGLDFDAEFNRLVEENREDTLMRLAAAYYFLMEGNQKRAIELLIVIQEQVRRERNEKRGNYVLFTYLTGLIRNDPEYQKTACEQAHRLYIENAGSGFYAFLEYRLNLLDKISPKECSKFLESLSRRRLLNAVFLQEQCLLYKKGTSYVDRLNALEIRALLYGLRHGLTDQQTLFDLLSLEITDRDLLDLYLLVLKCGYHRFRNPELLQAICTIFVNETASGPRYFPWYRLAVNSGISLKGLNELYLQSVPKDFNAPLPRNIVQYFGYGRMPERVAYDTLYMNVISFYGEDEEIMSLYAGRIRTYALRKMKNEEYSEPLVPIFRSVLEQDSLNEETAAPMLKLLYLRRITVTVPSPRRLIVHYPQLQKEAVYTMKNGTILVPVFSDAAIYAVEDIRGNRRSDPGLRSALLFEDEALREKCLLYVRESLYTMLSGLDPVLKDGITDDYEETLAKAVIRDPGLSDHYRAFLYAELAAYALRKNRNSEDLSTFLLDADLSEMPRRARADVLSCLIGSGFTDSAFKRCQLTGFEALDEKEKASLLRPLLNRQGDLEDDDLVYLSYSLYRKGKADNRVLQYLGSCLNAGTEDLLKVLAALREKHVPTGDMVIRTMTQMMYTGKLSGIETCFDWFMSEARWDDELFQAYLVLRSHGYLLGKHGLTDTESEALRTHAKELTMVSVLALLTWYAKTDRSFTEEDREIVAMLLRRAADEELVLSCFSELSGRFGLPEELEGRVFLELRDENAASCTVVGTIFPGRRFFQRTLKKIYGPIYARSIVLYPGEWINYYYTVHHEDGTTEEIEGPVVTLKDQRFGRNSRLSDVVRLTECEEQKSLQEGEAFVKELLLKDELIREIFRQ